VGPWACFNRARHTSFHFRCASGWSPILSLLRDQPFCTFLEPDMIVTKGLILVSDLFPTMEHFEEFVYTNASLVIAIDGFFPASCDSCLS
jgi:hypothetical protein